MKSVLVALVALLALVMAKLEAEMPIQRDDLLDKDLRELYARDAEDYPGPIAFGAKTMSGGAGEGSQSLDGDSEFKYRQEVKTDSVLPAYCEPPNPCPRGFTAKDGCTEEFENTAEFSREYQARQNCICDEEHMRDCPSNRDELMSESPENTNSLTDAINSYLDSKQIAHHKELTAKKGYQDHDEMREHFPRKKRSIAEQPDHPTKEYQWLKGERLYRVAKKGYKTL